ncbi:putative colanic acid biosynthesis acetyltransferase [Maribacter polysaccharolyticus]|uniref:putative colanic acid biosynthesis acetyltransferase n=1 Tax=Maribacter polysaccharolyticus TaxID=3020831 RepID=UPI00237F2A77|nr:putative colanic acid biosynthesis acetyltransferase [Maribacter polysaccharolyticus]MDE3741487.1 putative colanic acid biosynthesis acetyltransferase [Maribacter polysaccharolyticus]
MSEFDLSKYKERKPKYFKRLLWMVVNATFFRVAIGNKLFFVRTILLKMFGAKVPLHAMIYPSCKIHAPWNLEVGVHSTIGPNTEIYNKDRIVIGSNSVVSQGTYLCSASHDVSNLLLPLVTKPIIIGSQAWVAADVFVGPGVTIGEGAVVGARGVVFKDVDPWTVVGGNPAKFIKKRIIV